MDILEVFLASAVTLGLSSMDITVYGNSGTILWYRVEAQLTNQSGRGTMMNDVLVWTSSWVEWPTCDSVFIWLLCILECRSVLTLQQNNMWRLKRAGGWILSECDVVLPASPGCTTAAAAAPHLPALRPVPLSVCCCQNSLFPTLWSM